MAKQRPTTEQQKEELKTEAETPVAEAEKKEQAAAPVKAPRTEQLRKELEAEKAALMKELQPYRDYYDKHVNDAKYVEARKKIKELGAKIGPIDNELAVLARAGGAKGIQAEQGIYTSEEPK